MTRQDATGIPYDASFEAISEPAARGGFFELHQPQSEEAWCAELSRLAYCDYQAALRPALSKVGFRLIDQTFDREGLQGFVAQGPAFSVLVFRGTDTLTDWLTNFDAAQVDWPEGGRVHRGFARVLDAVWPQVAAAVAQCTPPLLITGHSQGGALGALSACRLSTGRVYSFGAPRIGNAAFQDVFEARVPWARRYVNHQDIICRIPLVRLGYRHVGLPHYIDALGNVTQTRPPEKGVANFLARALERDQLAELIKNRLPREMTDHAPINYVSALR